MNLQMNKDCAEGYTSHSQKSRVITEAWIQENMYCPYCGNPRITRFENNRPVADFFCSKCEEEYELKSKSQKIGSVICGGAYSTMIERIYAANNPNFLFLHYDKKDWRVCDLILIPKHFFVADIVEKRKPLSKDARRAGWVGCNIAVGKIPEEGKIDLVKSGVQVPVQNVIHKLHRTSFLAELELDARGWIMDIFNCMNKIPNRDFTLDEMYMFETELQSKHPDNHHVRDKIRQQLQLLRDKGMVEFKGRGRYRKTGE